MEFLATAGRHAEQLADHGHRQWERKRVDQVNLRLVGHRAEQLVGDLLDARFELLDAAAGERGGDQPAQPGVVRWVATEHMATHRREYVGRQQTTAYVGRRQLVLN